jgi:DNA polymerase-1
MNNGLHIDLNRVEDLEKTLDAQLITVTERLAKNPLIAQFQALQHTKLLEAYRESQLEKIKPPEHFLKPFKHKDLVHRSYFMYLYANSQGISQPSEFLPSTTIPKWDARLVKTLSTTRPLLQRLLDGSLTTHPLITEAMLLLATHKATLHNRRYEENLSNPSCELPPFNPGSPQQKSALFEFLGIESEATSKDTGLPSWDRDQIERVFHETTNDDVRELCQCFIDHSYAAIVRNNFIAAFYRYTINSRLHGQLKLFGAKSFRPTSNSPNMLNAPSTGSIFAKPLKRCFTAPPGKVVLTADYAALEDRVMANISKDPNKLALFLDNLDGHSLSAVYYFPERVRAIIGDFDSPQEASKKIKTLVDIEKDEKRKEAPATAVRTDAKPVNFGLGYGAFPPKVAATIKCPLEQAEAIFNAYHYEMFPGVSAYREDYVLPTAIENNELHLGLGCKILTDNAEKDIRTITNATIQFWSILMLLTISKLHQKIDEVGLSSRLIVTNTIYDAIYLEADADPEVIHWLNQTLIPIMTAPYLVDEIIHNEVDLEVGLDWSSFKKIDNNATLEEITQLLSSLE